jgi:hypothetical protein
MRPRTVAAWVLGLAIGVGGVMELREATLSTHQRVDPGSRVELVVEASSHRAEAGQSLQEMVEALLVTCRLEVSSDIELPVRNEGDGRFRAVVQPDLDRTDRRQLRGCIEDWTIDQLRVDVVGFDEVDDPL